MSMSPLKLKVIEGPRYYLGRTGDVDLVLFKHDTELARVIITEYQRMESRDLFEPAFRALGKLADQSGIEYPIIRGLAKAEIFRLFVPKPPPPPPKPKGHDPFECRGCGKHLRPQVLRPSTWKRVAHRFIHFFFRRRRGPFVGYLG